jgi:hypothetical protein
MSPEVAESFGPVMAKEVVDWIDLAFVRRWSEGFGKFDDPGVEAVGAVLRHRDFTITNVPYGKDQAEIALNARFDELIERVDGGHFVLGGEDHTVLDHVSERHPTLDGAWSFHLLMPYGESRQIENLTRKSDYLGVFKWTTLTQIRTARCEVRRHDPDARREHRRVVGSLLRRRAEKVDASPARRFAHTVTAIVDGRDDGLPVPEVGESFFAALASSLMSGGLDRAVANALAIWCGEHVDAVADDAPDRTGELLFRAAVDVALDGWINPEAIDATRRHLAAVAPELLTAFERAIAGILLPQD